MSMSNKKRQGKSGGIIKLILFVVALVLILSYFGINWSDVKENGFVQFILGLFSSFWN